MADTQDKRQLACRNCGKTFAVFLQQMAEHNQKIVCPHCGQEHSPSDAASDAAGLSGQPHRKS